MYHHCTYLVYVGLRACVGLVVLLVVGGGSHVYICPRGITRGHTRDLALSGEEYLGSCASCTFNSLVIAEMVVDELHRAVSAEIHR